MKRFVPALLSLVLVSTPLAGAAVVPTVKTATVGSLGKVLVTATGRTLYHYTVEAKGQVECTGTCAKLWPPLVVKPGVKLVVGGGLSSSKLDVVRRPDGTEQVTYGGFGLYLYSGDTKSGEANGEAISNLWYAVSPAAKIVTKAAPSSAGTGSSSSSSSGGSDGYGY